MIEKNIELLIPLIGVLIGWMLTNLSGYYKGINEKKKVLAKTLTQLHFLCLEQVKILNHFEFLKDTYGVGEEYEKMRFQAMERYVLKNDNLKLTLQIVSDLSAVAPITSIRLKQLIENYSFSQQMKFSHASINNNDLYLKMLSLFEAGFDLENKELKKIILKLSLSYGLITWIKMKLIYKKLEQNLANTNEHEEMYGLKKDLQDALSNLDKDKEKQDKKNK